MERGKIPVIKQERLRTGQRISRRNIEEPVMLKRVESSEKECLKTLGKRR